MLPALTLPVRALAAFNAPLARLGRNASALLLAAMVALAVAQILSRGLFSYSLDWAEELARFALVWSVLLIAPFAYRAGAHIAIGAFAEALPQRLLVAVSLALNAIVLWICVRCLIESFAFWERGLAMVATTVPMALAWVYAVVPATFALLSSVALELVLRLARAAWTGRLDDDLGLVGAVAATSRE